MPDDPVLLQLDGGLARITLNRPQAANTIDRALARALLAAVTASAENRAVRAVLLSGAGAGFSAGGDLRAFAAQGDDFSAYAEEVIGCLHGAIERLATMPAPVVAAVHGHAAGAGMSLALASDLVLAAESARFTMAYTRVGLTPDGGSTYFLPRIVGRQRALELILTNRTLTAEEAAGWGIVARVVPDDALLVEAEGLARQLASGPTGAFAVAKRLVANSWGASLGEQLGLEGRGIVEAGQRADGREGIGAFLAKRAPVFGGSESGV